VFPCQLPNKARTHSDVPIIEWLIDLATNQIHTIACNLLAETAVFQVVVACPTLTSHSSQNVYSRTDAVTIRLPVRPWLLQPRTTDFPNPYGSFGVHS